MNNFEIYRPPTELGIPAVTINLRLFIFNKPATEFLNNRNYCQLYYDKKSKIIGVKPSVNQTNYSLKITRKTRQIDISVRGFLSRNGLFFELGLLKASVSSVRRKVYWDDKQKMMLIHINEND